MTTAVTPADNGNGGPPLVEQRRGVLDELLGRLPDLEQELAGLNGERQQADAEYKAQLRELGATYQAKLRAIDYRRDQLNMIVEALSGAPASPRRRSPRRSGEPAKVLHVSNHALLVVLDGCLAHTDDDEFTSAQIHQETNAPWSGSYINHALVRLREREIIGLVRRQPGKGGSRVFRVLDRHRGERVREELAAEPEADTLLSEARKPGSSIVNRHIDAMRELNPERFTAADLAAHLDLKSLKGMYSVLRYLKVVGRIEEIGKTNDPHPRNRRTIYRLKETADA